MFYMPAFSYVAIYFKYSNTRPPNKKKYIAGGQTQLVHRLRLNKLSILHPLHLGFLKSNFIKLISQCIFIEMLLKCFVDLILSMMI
jgi:hypothetical protein